MGFGTYAADVNAIEYGQRLRHYAPTLKERGVESLHLILNADEAASEKFVELLGLEGPLSEADSRLSFRATWWWPLGRRASDFLKSPSASSPPAPLYSERPTPCPLISLVSSFCPVNPLVLNAHTLPASSIISRSPEKL